MKTGMILLLIRIIIVALVSNKRKRIPVRETEVRKIVYHPAEYETRWGMTLR